MPLFPRQPLPLRLLVVGGVATLLSALSYLSNGGRSIFVDTGFLDLRLHARLQQVLCYNHALPVVRLQGETRPRTLPLPSTCSSYVRAGDSIAKQGGANLVRVLRDSSGYRVVTEWASWHDPQRSQLVRYQRWHLTGSD